MIRLIAAMLCGLILFAPNAQAELESETEMERVCQNWLSVVLHEYGTWAGATDPRIAGVQNIKGRDGTPYVDGINRRHSP